MKKLKDEDDLTLINLIQSYSIMPIPREILFFIFMIILYYSGYARWLFWVIIAMFIFMSFSYMRDKNRKDAIIERELEKRGICK